MKASSYFSILFSILILSGIKSGAQQKGIWDHSFSFNGRSEFITFNVPSNYNPAKKYKLFVCLMGQGWERKKYADDKVWPYGVGYYANGSFGDVIIAVPGEGQFATSYFSPPGEDDGIIDATVQQAAQLYNIDQGEVYLQGFSFGAHTAMLEGLKNPHKYKALMLFTNSPGGATDTNQVLAMYNWSAINTIPTCLAVGENDQLRDVNLWLFWKLHYASNEKWTGFKIIPGLQHLPPPEVEAFGCYGYLQGVISDVKDTTDITKQELDFKVFPNPSSGNISIALFSTKRTTLEIYDLLGKSVLSDEIPTAGVLKYDISDQKKGIYTIIVSDGKNSITKKLALTD